MVLAATTQVTGGGRAPRRVMPEGSAMSKQDHVAKQTLRTKKAYAMDGDLVEGATRATRTGYCPIHKGQHTTAFSGVNEHGWVFFCTYQDDNGHYFTNKAPADE